MIQKKLHIIAVVIVLLVALIVQFTNFGFMSNEGLARPETRLGIHALRSEADSCTGGRLPVGKHGICIGILQHYYLQNVFEQQKQTVVCGSTIPRTCHRYRCENSFLSEDPKLPAMPGGGSRIKVCNDGTTATETVLSFEETEKLIDD